MATTQEVFYCPQCSFRSSTPNEWLAHLRTTEHDVTNFDVTCCFNECSLSFKSFSGLKSHIYRTHYKNQNNESTQEDVTNLTYTDTSYEDSFLESHDTAMEITRFLGLENETPSNDTAADIARLLGHDLESQKRDTALFIMRLREVNRISQTAIDDIVHGCRSLIHQTVEKLHAGVRQRLAEEGSNVSVSDVFDELEDPFTGLETQFLHEKYISKELNIIEPTTIELGTPYYIDTNYGRKRRKILRRDKLHYISLRDTLKMLLNNKGFFKQLIFTKGNNTHGTYFDFSDGSFFQSHPVVLANPNNCLQIIAYYDELEVCNPLGSSVKKHKVGCIFFTLGNLHPKHRSTFKTIFLSTVVNHTLVQKHGINSILKPFVNEMNELSTSGVCIQRNEMEENFKCALIAFLADNLASHTVGGFKQSMSFAKRICRSCLATKNESCLHFTAEEFTLRTPQDHELQCDEIANDTSANLEKSKEYGINERSILNDVQGFSVIGGLCHDVMHDLLEGVVPYELRLLLKHTFEAKYLTLSQYNDRVKAFDYGYTELPNKPSELPPRCFSENLKIRYSASEMLLVAQIIPFLIGDKIPTSNQHYICFLKLLEILRISLSPVISDDILSYFRVLIEEHHIMFTELYPNENVIPKMHYMVHYPNQISQQGPLIRSWTMRYEGKLSYFKGISRSGNFKNVTFSLAKRHQHWLAYHLYTGSMFTPDITRGPILSTHSINDETEETKLLIKDHVDDHVPFNDESIVTSLKWITIAGLKYSNDNCYLVSSINEDGEPYFSKIEKILSFNLQEDVYFIMAKCETTSYNTHLLAFSFIKTRELHVLSALDLPYSIVLHVRKEFLNIHEQYLSVPHNINCIT